MNVFESKMQTQSGFNFFLERKNEPRLDKSRNLKKTKAWQEGDFYIMYFNKQLSSNDLSHDINIGLFFKVHKGLFKNLRDFFWGLFSGQGPTNFLVDFREAQLSSTDFREALLDYTW